MSDPVLTELRDARARLVEHGWVQGRFGKPGVGFCVMGAFGIPWMDPDNFRGGFEARDTVYQAILALDLGKDGITPWNDLPGRTEAEVLEKFDEAIAKREEMAREEAEMVAPATTREAVPA